jgi:hypothetical protein
VTTNQYLHHAEQMEAARREFLATRKTSESIAEIVRRWQEFLRAEKNASQAETNTASRWVKEMNHE